MVTMPFITCCRCIASLISKFMEKFNNLVSSGSSGLVRGAEKHEIYAAAFGGHLFYDLFSQGQWGSMAPSAPLDPLLLVTMRARSSVS